MMSARREWTGEQDAQGERMMYEEDGEHPGRGSEENREENGPREETVEQAQTREKRNLKWVQEGVKWVKRAND